MELPTTLAFDGKRVISLGWKNPRTKKYENGIFPRFSILQLDGINKMTVNPNNIVNITYSPVWRNETETVAVIVDEVGQLGEPTFYPYIIVTRIHNITDTTMNSFCIPN